MCVGRRKDFLGVVFRDGEGVDRGVGEGWVEVCVCVPVIYVLGVAF